MDFDAVCGDLLRAGHRVRFRAHGSSMTPTIDAGETLTVVPVGIAALRLGDIVLYTTRRGPTAHRLVGRGAHALRMRGDAPRSPTEVVLPDQILGRVEAVERGGRLVRVDGVFARRSYRLGRWLRWLTLSTRARLRVCTVR